MYIQNIQWETVQSLEARPYSFLEVQVLGISGYRFLSSCSISL